MTHIKIEGHGHLGRFDRVYFIKKGEEGDKLIEIQDDLMKYLLKMI